MRVVLEREAEVLELGHGCSREEREKMKSGCFFSAPPALSSSLCYLLGLSLV